MGVGLEVEVCGGGVEVESIEEDDTEGMNVWW